MRLTVYSQLSKLFFITKLFFIHAGGKQVCILKIQLNITASSAGE